mmetsp:Transcript_41942/g.64222  ORF Transcript_41942/g.64222 Transcript_41942/m.64222 type:complete len:124 (-) Transcript_41942:2385-2756(-)
MPAHACIIHGTWEDLVEVVAVLDFDCLVSIADAILRQELADSLLVAFRELLEGIEVFRVLVSQQAFNELFHEYLYRLHFFVEISLDDGLVVVDNLKALHLFVFLISFPFESPFIGSAACSHGL